MTIDPETIHHAFLSSGIFGDEEHGLLHRFGVILNNSPVEHLVGRECDLINKLGPTAIGISEHVLVDAAQWCAGATIGGIMASQEWADVIQPNVNNVQDRFAALVAITNNFGYGKITQYRLDENTQELEFTVFSSYYTDYWLQKYGSSSRTVCTMWVGIAGAYMDLLFGKKTHDFEGEELKCAAKDGGQECIFKAARVKKKFGL